MGKEGKTTTVIGLIGTITILLAGVIGLVVDILFWAFVSQNGPQWILNMTDKDHVNIPCMLCGVICGFGVIALVVVLLAWDS